MQILEYNDYIIGYKKDLIEALNKEIERQRKDEDITSDELIDNITEIEKTKEELNKYDNYMLLAIGQDPMAGLHVKKVNIEMEF